MAENIDPTLAQVLELANQQKASDVLLTDGLPPYIRIDGQLLSVQNTGVLDKESIIKFIGSIANEDRLNFFKEQKDIDFSFTHEKVRYRANAFFQKGLPALSLRIIPSGIKTYNDLGLPPIVQRFAKAKRGLVIVAGPTGHGKSTTLASIINDINATQLGHIITIEDPVEYVFEHKRAVISQREIGTDTNSFARAMKSAVREDPNIILVGEMRDFETAESALTLAETGHLVLTTLHTNSAAQTADRLVNLFPAYLQSSIRQQLANVLLGIVSQRLIPKIGGGRVLATEILIATSAVRSLIREGKTHQLDNIIATSAKDGMLSLDKVLSELISKGDITLDDGLMWANDAKAVKSMLY